jgi:predicted permease
MTDILAQIGTVIVPVFLIVAVGYVYGRRTRIDMGAFNRIALDVLAPCLVFASLASKDFNLVAQAPLLLACALLVLGCGVVAWPLSRALGISPRTLVPVVMFNNCGNMGLPLALLAFGPAGLTAAVALFCMSNLFHFSIGTRLTSRHARNRDLLLSPVMLATFAGFAAALRWQPPELPLYAMKLLGDAMLPMMLFALGVRLNALTLDGARLGLAGALARPVVGLAVAVPLVLVMPALLPASSPFTAEAAAQLLLFAALPPAVIQFMFAEKYGQEPDKVAAMVLLGNALAVVFVPVGLVLGRALGN